MCAWSSCSCFVLLSLALLAEKLTVHPDIRSPGPGTARTERFFSSPGTSTRLARHRLHAAAVSRPGPTQQRRDRRCSSRWTKRPAGGAVSRSNEPAGRTEHGSGAEVGAVWFRFSRAGSRFGTERKSYQSIITSSCDTAKNWNWPLTWRLGGHMTKHSTVIWWRAAGSWSSQPGKIKITGFWRCMEEHPCQNWH